MKRILNHIFCLLLLVVTLSCSGGSGGTRGTGTGIVRGTVTDTDGVPLSNSEIVLTFLRDDGEEERAATATSNDGSYSVPLQTGVAGQLEILLQLSQEAEPSVAEAFLTISRFRINDEEVALNLLVNRETGEISAAQDGVPVGSSPPALEPIPESTPPSSVDPTPPDGNTTNPDSSRGIRRIVIVNAETDRDIRTINEGETVSRRDLPDRINFRVELASRWSRVESLEITFQAQSNSRRVENVLPYSAFGDSNGDYNEREPEVGRAVLSVTGYSEDNGRGNVLVSDRVRFVISR